MNALLAEKIKQRSSNINLLRFISAAAVIICHSYAVTSGEEDFFSRVTSGQCNLGGVAVSVFFFLSGLYVTKSLENNNSLARFLRKRCERIFPALWLVVILSVIIGTALSTLPWTEYWTNKATYLYLLNGFLVPVHDLPGVFEGMPYQTVNGPLWTMPVEVACYIGLVLVTLFAEKILKDREKRKVLIIPVLGVMLALFAFIQYKMPDNMLVSVIRAIIIFFEGVLYYEYKDTIRLNPAFAGIALVLLVLLGITPAFNFGLIILFPYIIVTFPLALPQLKHDPGIFSISYEMYLVGWPIQQVVMKLCGEMSPAANWLIALPIDIFIGWVLFKVVTKILQAGKERKEKAAKE